ncbi:unnamed protein product, partial [Brenthis ino]
MQFYLTAGIVLGIDSNQPEAIGQDLREYLMTSTLHGLRYIGEKKLTWCERFFWLAAFGSSLVCAAFFILNVYAKWRTSPMIVSINPENMPLNQLAFPAITICNVNQAKKSVAERYNQFGDPIDKKLLQSLCSTQTDADIFEDEYGEGADWHHTRSFLINVSNLLKQLNDMNFTFPLPSVDWTPETGYPADAPADGFPWRPKILLHNPTENPNIAKLGEVYGTGIEARVAIEPRILDAQPTLKYIDVNKRLCLFSSEKDLVFYRTYTLRNCEMECEARIMLDICKCVLYYMPKNKTTRVCGKGDAKCYSNMKKYVPDDSQRACEECLPACTEISYFERPSAAPLNKALVGHYTQGITLAQNQTPEYFT